MAKMAQYQHVIHSTI